jgi:MFS family permease
MTKSRLLQLPNLDRKVWILALGRLLSEIGTGFTLFYAPIFFVNQVGLSATLVGIGLGSGSVSGVIGRFLGGQWADSQFWGRRKTLLLSAAISAIADVVLVFTYNFPTFIIGNLLMGLGMGLYWPATEAAIADLTNLEQRNEAFAMARLADSIGLSLGVVLGGALIANSGNYRALFAIDAISFVIFFLVIYIAIAETYQFQELSLAPLQGWKIAFSDRHLMIFAAVNILFTTYFAQLQTTLPLYFKNFISAGGFSAIAISGLFSWQIACAALCQLPIAHFLNRFTYVRALMFSLLLWGGGFSLIWVAGISSSYALLWAILALTILAIAMVSYTPSASSFVADLAPESLRGIYLAINSQCWAIGYFIGPPLGGWALDNSPAIAHSFWLAIAASVMVGILILQYLERLGAVKRNNTT